MKEKATVYNFFLRLLIIIVLVGLWWLVSILLVDDLLPNPIVVFSESIRILFSSEFLSNLIITLGRIGSGLLISMLLAMVFGWLFYKNSFMRMVVETNMFLGLTIPSTVVTFIIIILFGTKQLALIAVIVAIGTPQLLVIIISGINSMDHRLFEMFKVFQMPFPLEFRHIILPQLAPSFFAALRTGISVSWKTSMIAETFAFSSGIGYQIYYQFMVYSLKGVLAWTISFIMVMSTIDVVINFFEKRSLLWKNINK